MEDEAGLMDGEVADDRMAKRFRQYLPVIVDVESGGLDCRRHPLLQIAWVFVRFSADGRMYPTTPHQLEVEPFTGCDLDPEALKITGIRPDDPDRKALSEKAALNTCFNEIRMAMRAQSCKRAILVGHNASFDHGFICTAAERQQIRRNPFHPFSTFDTCTLAGLTTGQTVLASACQKAGIDFDERQAHNASYDAQKTAELFCHAVNGWHQTAFDDSF